MSKYLDGYMSAIPAGQREAIESDLATARGQSEPLSPAEYQQELQRLLQILQQFDSGPSFEPPFVDEQRPSVISSSVLNDMFLSILTDLTGLFSQVGVSDQTLSAHDGLRKADWIRIRDAINKITEDLDTHRYLKLNPEWQDVRYFDFWNGRVGEPTAKAAGIDPEAKILTLGIKSSRRIEQLRGSLATTGSVLDITSAEEGSSRGLDPDNALDTNVRKFWAHLLLMDSTVRTTWKAAVYDGALTGFTMTFANAEFVNSLSFLPFGRFPLQLIDLEYYDGEWATVPDFNPPTAGLDWADTRFERIQASALRLILHQPNFVRNQYLVPRHAFDLAKVWDQVVDEELLLGMDAEDLTGAQQAEIETNPRFRAYLHALQDVETRLGQTGIVSDVLRDHENVGRSVEAITRVAANSESEHGLILQKVVSRETDADSESPEDLLEIDKVEYLFGLRSVRAHDNNYLPIGVYRSPVFATHAGPYEMALDVSETHVELMAPEGGAYRQSSAEYEIELSPDRRHAILPAGTTSVRDELVVIRPASLTGNLRFTPSGAVTGRASGRLLVSGSDFSVVGRTVTILRDYSPNYRYTFTYVPASGQDILDIDGTYDSVEVVTPEVFDHTDSHGMVELKSYPYVAYEIVNSDSDWARMGEDALWSYRRGAGDTTIDGIAYGPTSGRSLYRPISCHVNGVLAVNITDYRKREHPGFRADPEDSPVLQYLHAGRKIYLSRPVTDVTIEVTYRWMVQYIRLNVALRGHGAVVNSYTPVLSSYRLKTRTGR